MKRVLVLAIMLVVLFSSITAYAEDLWYENDDYGFRIDIADDMRKVDNFTNQLFEDFSKETVDLQGVSMYSNGIGNLVTISIINDPATAAMYAASYAGEYSKEFDFYNYTGGLSQYYRWLKLFTFRKDYGRAISKHKYTKDYNGKKALVTEGVLKNDFADYSYATRGTMFLHKGVLIMITYHRYIRGNQEITIVDYNAADWMLMSIKWDEVPEGRLGEGFNPIAIISDYSWILGLTAACVLLIVWIVNKAIRKRYGDNVSLGFGNRRPHKSKVKAPRASSARRYTPNTSAEHKDRPEMEVLKVGKQSIIGFKLKNKQGQLVYLVMDNGEMVGVMQVGDQIKKTINTAQLKDNMSIEKYNRLRFLLQNLARY